MHAGKVESLVRIDRASMHNAGFHARRSHFHCKKLDQSIVDEYPVADVHVVSEMIVRDRNLAFLLEPFMHEDEIFTGLDENCPVDVANTNARPLKITENRDWRADSFCAAAHHRYRLEMLRMRTVREVEAGHVHARVDQSFYRLVCR